MWPAVRATGGNRFDIGGMGACSVLMNLPYYLEFLVWRMICGGDGILEKSIYLRLRSMEVVALLRVLSILHISLCMPHRWLAGNCGDLKEYGFGVADMPEALDLIDSALGKVMEDGTKLLDEDFMMGMLTPICNKVPPLQDYLDYMFERKTSYVIGSRKEEDQVLPWDDLRAAVFYPTRKDIIQTNDFCPQLAVEAATVF